MFGTFSRILFRRGAPVARMQSAVVRRSMATERAELPSVSGTVTLLSGVGLFVAVSAWVNYNDLIVWGLAPKRSKAE